MRLSLLYLKLLMSNPFFTAKTEAVIIGEVSKTSAVVSERSWAPLFIAICSVLLLLFQMVFSNGIFLEREHLMSRWYQLLQQKQTELLNQEAIQSLLHRRDQLDQEYDLFARAVSQEPREDQVLSWIATLHEDLAREGYVAPPDQIAWRNVSEYDTEGTPIEGIGVTEYSWNFSGEYGVFLTLLQQLRESQRLLDLRSFRNLSFDDEGLVSADLVLWVYHSL